MRLILADDSVLLREGLARLLEEEGHEVVAGVGDADALLAAARDRAPDVAVVDVRMPPTHTDEGLRAALRIREDHPGVGVLVLSQYVEERYATQLLTGEPSGVGYVLKDRVAQVGEFLDALDRVAAGGAAFDPEVVRQLLTRTTHSDPLKQLTQRGTRGAGPHGAGVHQLLDRRAVVGLSERGGEARKRGFRQARPVPHHRVQPPGARGPALSGQLRRVWWSG